MEHQKKLDWKPLFVSNFPESQFSSGLEGCWIFNNSVEFYKMRPIPQISQNQNAPKNL